jgi:Flp pilus assembly protein TadD
MTLLTRPRLTILALAAVAGTLSGCGGHGQYTREHIAAANEKMSMLKSGTEYQMAQQQFLAGDLDKSMRTIDKSLALNPEVPKSHVLRGRILMEKGRLEQARESFVQAETLDEKNFEAQYYLGIIHERINEPEEAFARYSKAADLDPANPQYLVAAAEMQLVMGKLDEAEAMLSNGREQFRYNAAVRQSLGHVAMLRENPKLGAQLFGEALTLAPDDSGIIEDLIRAQMACGEFGEAEFYITRLMNKKENAERRDLQHMRARCLIALNRSVEARTELLDLTSHDEGSRDVRAWIDLGNVAANLNDRANLRIATQRVLAIAPTRYEGWMLRAMLSRIDGNNDQALRALEEALQRTSTDATPYVMAAMVLEDLGRSDDAVLALEAALNIDPGNKAAQTLLGAMTAPTTPSGKPVVGHGAASE